ncbi:MAG TPA: hypothetical protein VFK43_18650 [Acidimicrobiales bacterium]|nr:hypothetical protein [Acidimicrobiales bacterium]
MGLMDKARQTAEQARAGMLGERTVEDVDPDAPPPPPPSARAGAAINAFIERINPGLLADLIIHATAAQEKTNKALREKGSHYRISEMYLTASIPPQVGFYIARMGDPELAAEMPAPATKAVAKKRAPRPAGP